MVGVVVAGGAAGALHTLQTEFPGLEVAHGVTAAAFEVAGIGTVTARERREPTGELPPLTAESENALFRSAAEAAYAYLRTHRSPRTGLVRATEHYEHITTWDIGGLLLGVHAAGELELSPPGETQQWLRSILETLGEVSLFDGGAYNKLYAASTGQMIGMDDRPSEVGKGWSSTDLGRLLIALKVVEQHHPELAALARSAAGRIDFGRVVRGGYLHGEEPRSTGNITYQEGRIGYEQYAAEGFALWGHRATTALDLHSHGFPVNVMGQQLLGDRRGREKLTSEPVVLLGMELGWTPAFEELAAAMVAVQEARFRETGQVTVVSEDALQQPPHYFYYYTFWSDGEPFAVRAQGPVSRGPRWVSAKAAYAWHSLMPNGYTWRAVNEVEPARSGAGWSSGVYEGNGRSTNVRNINTAAVILQAALYRERGQPLLEGVGAWER